MPLQWLKCSLSAVCCPTWLEWRTDCPSFLGWLTSSTCKPSHRQDHSADLLSMFISFKSSMIIIPEFFWLLSQENVSCLNTSLVILMLARRRDKLPFYLNALREKEYSEKYPGCLLNNFHNLLRFWQHHYLNKDKDSTCLENVRICIVFFNLFFLHFIFNCIGLPGVLNIDTT